MLNLPTLNDTRNEWCKAYFARMKRSDTKLDTLLPNTQIVPYILRSFKLPIPVAFITLSQHLVGFFFNVLIANINIYLFIIYLFHLFKYFI